MILALGGRGTDIHSSSPLQSSQMTKLPESEVPYLRGPLEFYPISSSQLILFTTPAEQQKAKKLDGVHVRTLHAFRVDLTTHAVGRIPELENAVSEWPWFGYSVSPNGRSLICVPIDQKHPGRCVDLKSLASSPIDLMVNSAVVWSPDSRSFLDIANQGRIDRLNRFFEVEPSKENSFVSRDMSPSLNGDLMAGASLGVPLRFKSDNTVIYLSSSSFFDAGKMHQAMDIHEFKFVNMRLEQGDSFSFDPPDMRIYHDYVRVNAQGTRLLWHGLKQASSHQQSWCLYTSNLDGSQIVQLESIPIVGEVNRGTTMPPDPTNPDVLQTHIGPIFGAEWMPDGKTICFFSEGEFHEVVDTSVAGISR